MGNTTISWTNESSNPLKSRRLSDGKLGWYCRKVDSSCKNCYASTRNVRCGNNATRHGTGHDFKLGSSKHLEPWLNQKELDKIARKRKPASIFVCDMTDVAASIYECPKGHATENEDAAAAGAIQVPCRCRNMASLKWWPSEMIQKCFDAWDTAARNGMTIQMLSKRPLRLAAELEKWARLPFAPGPRVLPNGWHIGTSLGNRAGLHRIDQLRAIPAHLRFLSLEPLIEDLGEIDLTGIGWVILGGESGHGARPCRLEWIDSLVDQCRSAGVSAFVKQLGARPTRNMVAGMMPVYDVPLVLADNKGGFAPEWPGGLERFPREVP